MKLAVAGICMAFGDQAIGTKVLNTRDFMTQVEKSLQDPRQVKNLGAPGQHMVRLYDDANEMVSAGVGYRTTKPEDYVLREHRGQVQAFLKRDKAATPVAVDLVVYDKYAYFSDPEVSLVEKEVMHPDTTHVIVAVLAHASMETPPLNAWRFVCNLSGGNSGYNPDVYLAMLQDKVPMEHHDTFRKGVFASLDRLRGEARDIVKYWEEWAVVAD